MDTDLKIDTKFSSYNGTHTESHLCEGTQPAEFRDKLRNVLVGQTNAFKVNISLGYDLVSLTDGDFTPYWDPNLANVDVFETPFSIGSRFDNLKKIISEIRSMMLTSALSNPNTRY